MLTVSVYSLTWEKATKYHLVVNKDVCLTKLRKNQLQQIFLQYFLKDFKQTSSTQNNANST